MTDSFSEETTASEDSRPQVDEAEQAKTDQKGSSRWQWIASGIVIVLLAGGGAWWWLRPTEPESEPAADSITPVAVETGQAQLTSAAGDRALSGTVEAEESVTLTSRVRGQVLRLPVEEGDRVQADQLLAEIDVEDIQAQQRQAESGVAQARTAVSVAQSARAAARSQLDQARARRQEALGQLAEAEAELDKALLDQERFSYLEAEGAVPQSRLDQVNTRVNTLRARVDQIQSAIGQAEADIDRAESQVAQATEEVNQARQGVNEAEARVEQVRANLDYGLLQAPFAGIVTRTHSEVGTLAGPGQPIVTLENANRLQFTVSVPESLIAQVERGQPIPIRIDALNETLTGRVEQIIPAADPRSHSFTIKLGLPPTPNLISGMFGQVQLTPEGPNTRQAVTIPASAVVERMGLEGVYVVDSGTAQFQQITTGQQQDGRVEVFSGLEGGDRLILNPSDQVKEGVAVTLRP